MQKTRYGVPYAKRSHKLLAGNHLHTRCYTQCDAGSIPEMIPQVTGRQLLTHPLLHTMRCRLNTRNDPTSQWQATACASAITHNAIQAQYQKRSHRMMATANTPAFTHNVFRARKTNTILSPKNAKCNPSA